MEPSSPPPRPATTPPSAGTRPAAAAGIAILALAALVPLLPAEGRSPALARFLAWAPLGLGLWAAGLLLPPVRGRPALLALFLSVGAAVLLFAYHLRPDGPGAWDGDAGMFHRMAEEWPWRPGGWWRYRVLVPWVVHVLPLSTNLGYALLGFAGVAAAGPLVSLLLRDLGYGPAERHAGLALYLCSFAPLYNSWNYALPDPVAMAVLLLAARAIVRGRDAELALWLAVGCVTKEVVLFLVPVRWVWGARGLPDLRGLARTALVAAPAGLLFLGLRALPEDAASYAGFVTGPAWLFPWKHQPDNVARLYSPFAAGWGLVLLAALRPDRWARAGRAFAALVLLGLLVTDAGRMLVYLMPLAVPMMVAAAGGGPGSAGIPREGWWAIGLAALSMRLWEPFLVLWRVPAVPRRALALALLPAVVLLAVRARRRAAAGA